MHAGCRTPRSSDAIWLTESALRENVARRCLGHTLREAAGAGLSSHCSVWFQSCRSCLFASWRDKRLDIRPAKTDDMSVVACWRCKRKRDSADRSANGREGNPDSGSVNCDAAERDAVAATPAFW